MRAHFTLPAECRLYGQLCPDYTGIELGIGESLLVKAIGESTGRSLQLIKADLKKEGDLGLVAMVRNNLSLRRTTRVAECVTKNSKNMQKTLFKPKALTVPFVFSSLKEIALSSGHSVSSAISFPTPWMFKHMLLSLKARKYRSLRNSLQHVKAKRQNTSYGVWKASFG
jgi:hypothetical protein